MEVRGRFYTPTSSRPDKDLPVHIVGPQIRSGNFAEDKSLLLMPGIEEGFLSFQASSLLPYWLSYTVSLHYATELYWRIWRGGRLNKQMTITIILKPYGNYFYHVITLTN
jgi:hypothetical protein